jgi:hypothetical protein
VWAIPSVIDHPAFELPESINDRRTDLTLTQGHRRFFP